MLICVFSPCSFLSLKKKRDVWERNWTEVQKMKLWRGQNKEADGSDWLFNGNGIRYKRHRASPQRERKEKKKGQSPRDGETIICCPSRRKSSRSNQREFQAINTIGSMLASWPHASARHSQVSLWLLSAQSTWIVHYLCGKALWLRDHADIYSKKLKHFLFVFRHISC